MCTVREGGAIRSSGGGDGKWHRRLGLNGKIGLAIHGVPEVSFVPHQLIISPCGTISIALDNEFINMVGEGSECFPPNRYKMNVPHLSFNRSLGEKLFP